MDTQRRRETKGGRRNCSSRASSTHTTEVESAHWSTRFCRAPVAPVRRRVAVSRTHLQGEVRRRSDRKFFFFCEVSVSARLAHQPHTHTHSTHLQSEPCSLDGHSQRLQLLLLSRWQRHHRPAARACTQQPQRRSQRRLCLCISTIRRRGPYLLFPLRRPPHLSSRTQPRRRWRLILLPRPRAVRARSRTRTRLRAPCSCRRRRAPPRRWRPWRMESP